MTAEMFKTNLKRYRKVEALRATSFLGLLALVALPNWFLVKQVDSDGIDAASLGVVSLSYTLIAMLMLYVLVPARRHLLVKWGLQCPGCGRPLFGKLSGEVLSTGTCSCGRPILHHES